MLPEAFGMFGNNHYLFLHSCLVPDLHTLSLSFPSGEKDGSKSETAVNKCIIH